MQSSIARKRRLADPEIVSYLIDEEFDVVVEATTRSESYAGLCAGSFACQCGLEITEILLDNGNRIVYQAIDGIGEAFYYDARGRCYLTIEE